MAGDGVGDVAVGRRALGEQPQAHQPTATHHREGHELVLEAGRIGGEIALAEKGDVERIVRTLGDGDRQGLGAFAHHAHVATVDQGRPRPVARRGQEAGDIAPFEDHPAGAAGSRAVRARLAIQAARSSWILRAASAAARCWLS